MEQATLHPVRPAPTLFSGHRAPPSHFDGQHNTVRKAAINTANVNCQGVAPSSLYVHQPLRDLGEVVQEIRDLEKETEGLLEQILDFGNHD